MVPPALVTHHKTNPVKGLPVELLTRIFWLHGSVEVLTGVCQHWRAVALECPSLWTRIPVDCSGRTRAYLERSGKLPLAIYVKMDNRNRTESRVVSMREGLQSVFANSSCRIREIYVDLDRVSFREETAPDGANRVAALFDELVLDIYKIMAVFDLKGVQTYSLNVRLEEEYGPQLEVPPNLTCLRLNGLGQDMRCREIVGQSLSVLHIACTAVWSNVLDAALALYNMPGLGYLCLLNYEEDPRTCPVMGDEPYDSAALERVTVRLSKLQKLRFRLRLLEADRLLNVLSIPLSTRWALELQSDD